MGIKTTSVKTCNILSWEISKVILDLQIYAIKPIIEMNLRNDLKIRKRKISVV